MPGGIARSLRVTAQRSGQGSKTDCRAASASPMRADLDGENDVARWVQQQASPTPVHANSSCHAMARCPRHM